MKDKRAGVIASSIATWFGCGYSPKAPGTAGSAGALAAAWLLAEYGGMKPWHFGTLAALCTPVGIWAAGRKAREAGKTDPGLIVIDEVLGQWLALGGAARLNWKSYMAAFVLFRVFDIVKPAPARQAERLPEGYGIVADDLVAGLYAALVLFTAGCFNLY